MGTGASSLFAIMQHTRAVSFRPGTVNCGLDRFCRKTKLKRWTIRSRIMLATSALKAFDRRTRLSGSTALLAKPYHQNAHTRHQQLAMSATFKESYSKIRTLTRASELHYPGLSLPSIDRARLHNWLVGVVCVLQYGTQAPLVQPVPTQL